MCEHKFAKFSIAMIGIRWQCVKCDLIAPACFEPTDEAKSKSAMIDEILDALEPDPWERSTGEPGSAAYEGGPIYNRESYFRQGF